jgi:arylsulfatase A-like enzyme
MSPLPRGVTTLAEIFRRSGYRTACFSTIQFVSDHFRVTQGFQYFDRSQMPDAYARATSAPLSDRVIEWLRSNRTHPFFLYAHYFDPHHNYLKHSRYDFTGRYRGRLRPNMSYSELCAAIPHMTRDDRSYLEALYDGEIAFSDVHIGRVLAALRYLGLDDHTLVILTADHGEEFGEHGAFFHGKTLYQPAVRVPLIMVGPHSLPAGSRITRPVELIGVYPTALELARLEVPRGIHGHSLVGLVARRKWASPSPLTEVYVASRDRWVHKAALRRDQWKLITEDGVPRELFDLQADPGEHHNLLGRGKPQEKELAAELARTMSSLRAEAQALRAHEAKGRPALTEDDKKALRGMGYLR